MYNNNTIPIEVLNNHLVALGKTGSGKSSALRVLVERLLDLNRRICIIDIKGDWYGLKLGADGKSAGYPLMAFGNFKNPDATDIQINERHGKEIAKLVVTGNRPCVIGFRGWMPGQVHKFWIDFVSTIFNENREPLSLVVDEIHNYSPKGKVLSPEIGNSIYWTNKIATEGRGVGIRLMAASVRPAKVHNDFLAACETLIAMRVSLPADKKALQEWMMEYSDDNTKNNLILNNISKIKTGEGFVWSAEAEIFEQTKFPLFKTFDSFASPKEGKQKALKGWASVNIDEVKEKLSKVIEEGKENDPKELKKKIRELEIQLSAKQKEVPVPAVDFEKNLEKVIAKKVNSITFEIERKLQKTKQELQLVQSAILKNANNAQLAIQALKEIKIPEIIIPNLEITASIPIKDIQKKPIVETTPIFKKTVTPKIPQEFDNDKLLSGARRMLSAVCMFKDTGLTMQQIKVLASIQDPSTFSRYKTTLTVSGMWSKTGDKFYPTASGYEIGNTGDAPSTTKEIIDVWMNNLIDGARRMLTVLISYNGEFISPEQLMQEAQINDPSTYSRYKTTLTTTHLAVVNSQKHIAANKETLFL